ncbi:MAG: hypothetical protein FWH38_00330 [Treponema sp.]|nr:hypothetical protein [Treponema sp.]
MKKYITAALAPVFLLCLCAFITGCGDGASEAEADSVTSIRLMYNDAVIPNNSLTVNLSDSPLTFTADVQVTGKASKDFTLASSDASVAEVSGKTVTLAEGGKAIITATAEGDATKRHSITLNVTDDRTFDISVSGGTASKEAASPGETITLTPQPPDGKVFVDWTVDPPEVAISGNQFTMPACNVAVTGNFEDVPDGNVVFTLSQWLTAHPGLTTLSNGTLDRLTNGLATSSSQRPNICVDVNYDEGALYVCLIRRSHGFEFWPACASPNLNFAANNYELTVTGSVVGFAYSTVNDPSIKISDLAPAEAIPGAGIEVYRDPSITAVVDTVGPFELKGTLTSNNAPDGYARIRPNSAIDDVADVGVVLKITSIVIEDLGPGE